MSDHHHHPTAVSALRDIEPRFGPVIDRFPCRIPTEVAEFDVFDSLASAIVSQQLSTKAARTIFDRVAREFGDGTTLDPQLILAADIEAMRAQGLSRPKAAYMKDLATRALANELLTPTQMKTLAEDEIVAALTQVKGIGRWTVEMLLIFDLGRLDVWPVDDLGVRTGYQRLLGLETRPTAKELMPLGARFQPYRSVAAWYLWRALTPEAEA